MARNPSPRPEDAGAADLALGRELWRRHVQAGLIRRPAPGAERDPLPLLSDLRRRWGVTSGPGDLLDPGSPDWPAAGGSPGWRERPPGDSPPAGSDRPVRSPSAPPERSGRAVLQPRPSRPERAMEAPIRRRPASREASRESPATTSVEAVAPKVIQPRAEPARAEPAAATGAAAKLAHAGEANAPQPYPDKPAGEPHRVSVSLAAPPRQPLSLRPAPVAAADGVVQRTPDLAASPSRSPRPAVRPTHPPAARVLPSTPPAARSAAPAPAPFPEPAPSLGGDGSPTPPPQPPLLLHLAPVAAAGGVVQRTPDPAASPSRSPQPAARPTHPPAARMLPSALPAARSAAPAPAAVRLGEPVAAIRSSRFLALAPSSGTDASPAPPRRPSLPLRPAPAAAAGGVVQRTPDPAASPSRSPRPVAGLPESVPETAAGRGGGAAADCSQSSPTDDWSDRSHPDDEDELADRVLRRVLRRLAIEGERRGWRG